MRRTTISLTLASLLVSSASWAVVHPGVDLTDRYIVVLKKDASPNAAQQVLAAIDNQRGAVLFRYQHTLQGFAVQMPLTALQGLQHRFPDIDYIEPDLAVQAMPRGGNKPNNGDSGTSTEPPQTTPWGIKRVGGFVDMSGDDARAWIIDTGIDDKHPDLNVDARSGRNFSRGKPNQTSDGNGHGTHVAGTVGAIDNAMDVVGVAAGVTVVPVRVLDNAGSGTISGVIAGVDYVAEAAASGDCANLSLGAKGYSQALDTAIKTAADAGILFSIAAGNSADDASLYTPASTVHPNVYTVSAIDNNDNFAYFSNYGSDVEYAAPGVSVLSTKAGGGTVTYNGTSMAAPHMCGVLLVTRGQPSMSGYAEGDPDGNPDPIVHQ